jgi:ribosomal protein S3
VTSRGPRLSPSRRTSTGREVELDVKGETDEELAASLVAEMLRTGLTQRL